MSSGQQQPPPPRRVTNVGSLLLTPQENESLFTFLGKKCVVSGRAPRRRPRRSLTGAGRGAGKWERGRRRERRVPGLAAAQAARCRGALAPLSGCEPCGPSCPGAGKCHLRRPVPESCLAGPGSAPLQLLQTLLSGHNGIFLPELRDLMTRGLASPPASRSGATFLHNARGFRSGSVGKEAQI